MEAIVILLVVDKNLLLTISSILYYEVQTKTEGMFALHVILKVHYHKVVAHSLKGHIIFVWMFKFLSSI